MVLLMQVCFMGIGTSLLRLSIGLTIAIAGGLVLGIFMARVETVNQTIGSLVLGLQSIPSIAWGTTCYSLVWSYGHWNYLCSSYWCDIAVTINTYTGVKNINPSYIEAARNMGAKEGQLITSILILRHFHLSYLDSSRVGHLPGEV